MGLARLAKAKVTSFMLPFCLRLQSAEELSAAELNNRHATGARSVAVR
jgi:hypothetical protein